MQFENMQQFADAVTGDFRHMASETDIEFTYVFDKGLAILIDSGVDVRSFVRNEIPVTIRHLASDQSNMSITKCLGFLTERKGCEWLPIVRFTPDQVGDNNVMLPKINNLNLGPETMEPAEYWKAVVQAYAYLRIQWAAFFHLYPFYLGDYAGPEVDQIKERIQTVTFQEMLDNKDSINALWVQKLSSFNPFIVMNPK